MASNGWKDIAELVGITAIVASLVFVGLQMRQTHDIALATLYQMRSDAARELRLSFSNPGRVHAIMDKLADGEELTVSDVRALQVQLETVLSHFENSHYLHSLGYLPTEHWEGDKNQISELVNSADSDRSLGIDAAQVSGVIR